MVFWLLTIACIPAYCLSILWTNPPTWVFIIAALAASIQLIGLIIFIKQLYWLRNELVRDLAGPTKILWLFSLVAFSIKLLLQALSVIPILGQYAFGARPVIIGYLHLVVLGFISFFLFGFFILEKLFQADTGIGKKSLVIFISGVLFNEILLLLQGINSIIISSWSISGVFLLGAALLIFLGLLLFFCNQFYHQKLTNENSKSFDIGLISIELHDMSHKLILLT